MAPDCPECGGTGFKITNRTGGGTSASRCDCSFRDQATQLVRSAKIPPRYKECIFDHFYPKEDSHHEALSIAQEWVDRWPDMEGGHSLLFYGPPGTGKTHLSVSIILKLAETKGARVVFYEQRSLMKRLQGTFDRNSEISESQVLKPIQDADILVLDDLGAGRTSDWARDVLHEIITHRYDQRKQMIITTNCELEADEEGDGGKTAVMGDLTLRQRLGDALMSRLYEMCRLVPIDGEDYRRKIINEEITRA